MNKHPAVCRHSNAGSWEWGAETVLETLNLFGAETSLDGVNEVAIGGSSGGEPSFDDTRGGYRDLVKESLRFAYNRFGGSGTLEDFLFRSTESSVTADGDFHGGGNTCADKAIGELAERGHGLSLTAMGLPWLT